MQIKEGVNLNGLQIEMRAVLITAHQVWEENGQELVITDAVAPRANPASYHPYGYAIDLRTRYFDRRTAQTAADQLQYRLGNRYVVIIESDHIHVHYPTGVLQNG